VKSFWLDFGVALVLGCASGGVSAEDVSRGPGETDLAFAERVLHLADDADAHVTAADWNGVASLFVDYKTGDADPERPLVVLQRQASGGYRTIQVTVGEQEGGTPDVVAVGFANADRDPAKELIVILTWAQEHYDVSGTFYEVRIFDDPKPGQAALSLLRVSQKLGSECDCTWRNGRSKHYRFKTIAAVKAELRRLGY